MDLYGAARAGDEQAVRELLAAGAAAETADEDGRLPHHGAVRAGHVGVVQQLLDAAPSTVSAVDSLGWTPLHYAAELGHAVVLQQLLKAAPATASAATGRGWTPLHYVAEEDHTAVVQLLLEAAPATAFAMADGVAPLHIAAKRGHAAVVQQLLQAVPATVSAVDTLSWTPLHYAALLGHSAVVQQLLEAAPATVTAVDDCGWTLLDLALNRGAKALAAAQCLVQAALTVQPTLGILVKWHPASATLFADLVSRLALTQQQWHSIPAPCPDLARALPIVLARSGAEAGWLVGGLGQEQRARLRTAALSLGRAAAGARGVPSLPAELTHRILALALAPP